MMIDWISCRAHNIDIERLREVLDFKTEHFSKTGEISIPLERADWNYLKFEIFNNLCSNQFASIKFSGSLHKFYHGHNYNDFFIEEIHCAIYDICNLLNITTEDIELHSLEFGVNITDLEDTDSILARLLLHKKNKFKTPSYRKSRGFMQTCYYNQFEVKIYNKGMQYKLPINVLRYEIKVTRMAYLREKGIKIQKMNDLLNIKTYSQLSALLLKIWGEIIIKETIIMCDPKLNSFSRKLCTDSTKYDFWYEQASQLKSHQFIRLRNRYREIVKNSVSTNYHSFMSDQIMRKWQQLSKVSISYT